jgi:hypothetical protein
MQNAYQGVMDWNVSSDQVNPDRGTYKDALQASTASKYVDSEISKNQLGYAADVQTKLMQANTKNTQELMTTENNFKMAGMDKSHALSKDFLGAQTDSDIAKTRVSGQEQRAGYQTQGQENRASIAETGNQQRQSLAYDRATAYQLARTGLARS